MAHYAVIENGLVTNVILADSLEIAETVTDKKLCVEIEFVPNSPSIGWEYDGKKFSAPKSNAVEEETP